MKRIYLLTLLLLACYFVNGQNNFGVFFSQNLSTFRFIDSEGNKDDLKFTIKYAYGLTYQREFTENIFLEGLLSYSNKGANSSEGLMNLDWSFHYLNTAINAGYKIMYFCRLHPHGGLGVYYGRLLKANQFIGSEYYDLMPLNIISKNDFGVNIFAGLEYEYSNSGFIFLRLNQEMGLHQLEVSDQDSQRMYNRTFSIQIGFLFKIN